MWTYRLIFGCWVLGIAVLVNAYKGIFSSSILAPAPARHTWKHIEELGRIILFQEDLPPSDFLSRVRSVSLLTM